MSPGRTTVQCPMDVSYRVRGGIPLRGDVFISGSKNAALPLIAGSILPEGETVLANVPRIRDTVAMLEILTFLGAETSFEGNTIRIRAEKVRSKPLPAQFISPLRGSILLLGPLLSRFGFVEMAYPGGCAIGLRSVAPHIEAFKQMGVVDRSMNGVLRLEGPLQPGHVIVPDFSVTATETIVLASAALPGTTRIDLAAADPHIQAVQGYVKKMGAGVEGEGTHSVTIQGTTSLRAATFTVPPDYVEAGTFALAAFVTRGKLQLHNVEQCDLLCFLDTLRRFGVVWAYNASGRLLYVDGAVSFPKSINIHTTIFPGFPTDLQPQMGVAMTQGNGASRLFECLYDNRLAYLAQLRKMGADVDILNPHEAIIIGPTPLKGCSVVAPDIRAGAAVVLAGLCAEGETTITEVSNIERGYERLETKLQNVGAVIRRIEQGSSLIDKA